MVIYSMRLCDVYRDSHAEAINCLHAVVIRNHSSMCVLLILLDRHRN